MKQRSYIRSVIVILIGIAFVFLGHWKNYKKVESADLAKFQDKIQVDLHDQERALLKVMNDTTYLKKVVKHGNSEEELLLKLKKEFFDLIIYKNLELSFWSTNVLMTRDINRWFKSEYNLTKFDNGFYEVIRKDFGDGYTVLGIIPIYRKYPLNNKYLMDGFSFDIPGIEMVKFSPRIGEVVINSLNGEPLFTILSQLELDVKKNNWPLTFQILGLLIIFLGINLILVTLVNQKKSLWALGGLLLAALLFELVLNQGQFLKTFYNYFFFSSQLYASQYYGDSLGTLMIRSVLLFWVVLFINKNLRFYRITKNVTTRNVIALSLLLAFTLFFILYFFIVQSLVQHSTISFDFYNFYTLGYNSFIGIFLFCLLGTVLYIIGQNAVKWASSYTPTVRYIVFILNAALVIMMALFLRNVNVPLVGSLYGAFLLFLYYELQFDKVKFYFFKYILLLSLLAVLTSYAIIHNVNLNNVEYKKDFVSKLLFERNYNEEFKFEKAQRQIETDNFIKNYFKNPYVNNINLLQRITNLHLSEFSSDFNIHVVVYNAEKKSLKGKELESFRHYFDLFENRGVPTAAHSFRYIESGDRARQYLGLITVKMQDEYLGYLVIEIVPKVFGASSAYPELLIENPSYDIRKEEHYAYAIYKNKILVKTKGEYEYTNNLNFEVSINEYSYYQDRKFNHIVYSSDMGSTVVLSEHKPPIINPISIFSYVFCCFLIFLVLVNAVGLREAIIGNSNYFVERNQNSLQRRIQLAMIGLVLISLLVVGVITLFFFQEEYNEYHNSRLLRKVKTVINDLDEGMAHEQNRMDGAYNFSTYIIDHIGSLAKVHSLDMNVFDRNGNLMTTSQPDIFDKGLLSRKMDPLAYLNLEEKGKTRYVHDEYIGKLKFLSAYSPYENEKHEIVAYLNFPYYGEQQTLRADISYLIVALVNVYVLLILGAAMFAVLLSRSITTSLTVIRESLSRVKLGVKSTPISLTSEDEIGLLVNEYNRMIEELEDSANLLARSERESAWREMAKQVAHEIKNPLTPMKLSIQHLERALKEDRDDIQELTGNITKRLIEQIDNLSHIASEFSSFAKMPAANKEEVDLVHIIESTAELFNDIDNITIEFDTPESSCAVFADKNQILRVFNNLLKNATQAIPEDKLGMIKIRLMEKGDTYRIEVEDNGIGIDHDKGERVFEPNFTTKSSGTGLGLAMAKNIVEKSDGRIWFESVPGKGTTFIIILPRIKGE